MDDKPKEKLDQRSQEILDTILEKAPDTLNKDDVGFLRARISYLKKAQIEEYDSTLNPKVKKEKAKEESSQTSEESEPVNKDNAKTKK